MNDKNNFQTPVTFPYQMSAVFKSLTIYISISRQKRSYLDLSQVGKAAGLQAN